MKAKVKKHCDVGKWNAYPPYPAILTEVGAYFAACTRNQHRNVVYEDSIIFPLAL